jgi:hypothetical protein
VSRDYDAFVYRGLVIGLAVVIACATAGRENPNNGDATSTGDGKVDAFKFLDSNGCATQPCDIPTQCGCGSGACDIDGSDLMGTACRMIATPGHETSTCSGPTGCDKDYVCLGGAGDASCHKYCGSDAECGTPRGKCAIDIQSGGTVIPGIPSACSSNCDPANTANPAVCPSTMKCSIFSATHMGTMLDISDCAKAGAGTQGTTCQAGSNGDDTLCAANNLCTTLDGTTFNCRRICIRPGGAQCVGTQTCLGFNPALTIGGTEYGVCN